MLHIFHLSFQICVHPLTRSLTQEGNLYRVHLPGSFTLGSKLSLANGRHQQMISRLGERLFSITFSDWSLAGSDCISVDEIHSFNRPASPKAQRLASSCNYFLLLPFHVSFQFNFSVTYNSLRPHGLQHASLPSPSPTPRSCATSFPSSR